MYQCRILDGVYKHYPSTFPPMSVSAGGDTYAWRCVSVVCGVYGVYVCVWCVCVKDTTRVWCV